MFCAVLGNVDPEFVGDLEGVGVVDGVRLDLAIRFQRRLPGNADTTRGHRLNFDITRHGWNWTIERLEYSSLGIFLNIFIFHNR